MTVQELIKVLQNMPQQAKVTDVNGFVVCDVLTQPKEGVKGDWVWLQFSLYQQDL